MNTLFLVHVEPDFESYFPVRYLRTIQRFIERTECHVVHFTYNRVCDELVDNINQEVEWGWGYEYEHFYRHPDELKWLIDSPSPHKQTWVPPFLREYKGPVLLGGGYESECLADMEAVLQHVKCDFIKVPELVYGS